MIGTLINAVGIVMGAVVGWQARRPMSAASQQWLKFLLGALAVFVGLRTTWANLGGGFGAVLKQLTIIVVAMMLGRLVGRLVGLQKLSNRLGQYAKEKMTGLNGGSRGRASDGFLVCAILYCVGPMAALGAVLDGLGGQWQTLALKAALDGLVAMGFVSVYGWGVVLAVVPVVAYQGTLTLAVKLLAPSLEAGGMLMAVNGTAGLLVFSVALVIWEIKKIEFADYLPSLALAPLLAWVWQ